MIGIEADLTLIFDLRGRDGLARTAARTGGEDRFEQKGAAFQEALRTRFHAIAAAEPERCHLIDAARTPEEISADVIAIVTSRLETR